MKNTYFFVLKKRKKIVLFRRIKEIFLIRYELSQGNFIMHRTVAPGIFFADFEGSNVKVLQDCPTVISVVGSGLNVSDSHYESYIVISRASHISTNSSS